MGKNYIIWYNHEGEEVYTIIMAFDENEAINKFHLTHSNVIEEIHEICMDNDSYLAFA